MRSSLQRTETIPSQFIAYQTFKGTSARARRYLWYAYLAVLVLSDVLMMLFAYWLAYLTRFEIPLAIFQSDAFTSTEYYEAISIVFAPLWVIIFAMIGLYNQQKLLGGTEEYSLVFRGATINLLIWVILSFLQPTIVLARGWLLLAWIFSFFFVALSRFWMRRVVYYLRKQGYFLSPAIIIGANDEGISLAQQILNWPTSGIAILGFIDKKLPPGTPIVGNLKVIGSLESLYDIVYQYEVNDIIMASSAITSHDSQLDIFNHFGFDSKVNIRMSSGLYEIVTTGLSVKEFAYVPLVGINKVKLTGTDLILKTILEYILIIPALIFLSPFLAIIALAIKLDSPGPIFHKREVMGVNGRKFDAYKFRTMYIEGDIILEKFPVLIGELQKYYKIVDDPRITKIGHLLRRYSLDEIPQLFNVLKMEMALVGPRMISPDEMSNYNQWGINLLTVRPGLTGLWQVSGRSDLDYQERVRLDMYYIRNWSIWQDIQLIIRTIPAVLKGEGAY